ncbi:MAG: hypothetical protein ACKOEZ_13055, partial [Spartobacteria bacterium]
MLEFHSTTFQRSTKNLDDRPNFLFAQGANNSSFADSGFAQHIYLLCRMIHQFKKPPSIQGHSWERA